MTQSFTLTIGPDCNYTQLLDMALNDMTILVGDTSAVTKQNIEFLNSKALLYSLPNFCGGLAFSNWSATTPSFVSVIKPSGDNLLKVQTNDPLDVGVYSISFDVSLADYSGVPSISKSLTVTVVCVVNSFSSWSPNAININIEPGVTTQPVTTSFSLNRNPDCNVPITYQLTSPSVGFVSLTSITATGGAIQVNGATMLDQGTYSVTLLASIGDLTKQDTITVKVTDPCKNAVIQTTSIPNIVLVRNLDTTPKTQSFSITTNLQALYGISCPITCVYNSPATVPGFVQLSGWTITADPVLTTSTDVGSVQVKFDCDSTNWPGSVANYKPTITI